MIPRKNDNRGGLVRTVILVVIVLLVVSYFGLNLRNIVNAPTTQDNFSYVTTGLVNTWNSYLAKPASYVWNDIVIPYFWKPFLKNLSHIQNGEPTDIQTAASSSMPRGQPVVQ